ncbi:MAG: hypothetical protein OER88_11115, partial [Planctomycetota bacterium]|nr:hypothetical protein [Planctomycetota bacterium]
MRPGVRRASTLALAAAMSCWTGCGGDGGPTASDDSAATTAETDATDGEVVDALADTELPPEDGAEEDDAEGNRQR